MFVMRFFFRGYGSEDSGFLHHLKDVGVGAPVGGPYRFQYIGPELKSVRAILQSMDRCLKCFTNIAIVRYHFKSGGERPQRWYQISDKLRASIVDNIFVRQTRRSLVTARNRLRSPERRRLMTNGAETLCIGIGDCSGYLFGHAVFDDLRIGCLQSGINTRYDTPRRASASGSAHVQLGTM
ncbi:hypothetical protein BDN67DRAFT_983820 [Paxillus ammoniavirescens]|nr:hypothetical protein BDN67DRAFT_983820 [Paxillus ammoniavirescens]